MKKLTLFLSINLILGNAYSQTIPAIDREVWNEKPALHTIDKKFNDESAVVISDIRRIEFIDDEKGNVHSFKTLHKIIHVNDDKGIEAFNKVYLPVTDNTHPGF